MIDEQQHTRAGDVFCRADAGAPNAAAALGWPDLFVEPVLPAADAGCRQREVDGQGFTALYENFLETQVATLALKLRF